SRVVSPAVPVRQRGAGRDPERDGPRLALHGSGSASERLSLLHGGLRAAGLVAVSPLPHGDRALPPLPRVSGHARPEPRRLDHGIRHRLAIRAGSKSTPADSVKEGVLFRALATARFSTSRS